MPASLKKGQRMDAPRTVDKAYSRQVTSLQVNGQSDLSKTRELVNRRDELCLSLHRKQTKHIDLT